jgi:outer membrane protein TolC
MREPVGTRASGSRVASRRPKGAGSALALSLCALVSFAGSVAAFADEADMPDPVCEAATGAQQISLADAIVSSLQNETHVRVARLDVAEAKADVDTALTPFLPKMQIILDEERYLPNNTYLPVTVVGNNVLGGTRSYSAYAALTLSWNILSSGRDMAGMRAANAEERASAAALHSQFNDALGNLLKTYADVYETGVSLNQQWQSFVLLKAMAKRADERYRHGNGTTIAIGQARGAVLDAQKAFNDTCRSLTEKSSALAKAMGARLPPGHVFAASVIVPEAPARSIEPVDIEKAIDANPAVESAKDKVVAAEQKLKQTHAAFGPSISIDARRDYLGQNVDSLSAATNSISPNSYRIGVSLVQPVFPFAAELGALAKAKAEVRRAEALTDDARNEADGKLRTAVSARAEAESSYRAARSSLREAESVLALTESLYKAGRAALDDLEHAKIDEQKVEAEVATLESQRALAAWDVERTFEAEHFPTALMQRVGIAFADQYLD